MPFVRLLPSLITGIILHFHFQFQIKLILVVFICSFTTLAVYAFLPITIKFRFSYLSGLLTSIILISGGSLLAFKNDIRNHSAWIGHQPPDTTLSIITLTEPLVIKPNSFKAQAHIQTVSTGKAPGKQAEIIIYFKKDSAFRHLSYGSKMLTRKKLQPIQNSGNPGAFDYRRYCLFQGITHQLYLTPADIYELPGKSTNAFRSFIFDCRTWVVKTLQQYIPGKKEQGLAEALLIGYKDDLDKNLVQSYSNTGVVHVIAISGLHLGLIYAILLMLTRPIKKLRRLAWLRLLLVITSLWIFSILAGAQPSVLRSAVMFTFLACGEVINRKGSVYNTMAMSAFLLLCYQPYWLWDAGFQLSYSAVLSIIVFYRPVYNWFYFKKRLADAVWKLNAVTISAQLLTMPVSIYHFNQLPTLFMFTNLIAVPLSSLILIGEILLCVVSFFSLLANWLGYLLHWCIFLMNSYIEKFDLVPWSVWSGLSISLLQAVMLTAFIIFFCTWLMEKMRLLLWLSGIALIIFTSIRFFSFFEAERRSTLIVYNIPKQRAIELIRGRSLLFYGNATDPGSVNFHLKPSRILHRTKADSLPCPAFFSLHGRQVLILDSLYSWKKPAKKTRLDLLVMSGNPKIYIRDLVESFEIRQLVIDGSVPAWKAAYWKKDCREEGIPFHDVSENGAFIMHF